jgi:hypothetical protein
VDQGLLETVAVKDFTAAARHQGAWFLRGHPLAGLPHSIFACGPIPFLVPSLKIRFRPLRQEHSPCILKFEFWHEAAKVE